MATQIIDVTDFQDGTCLPDVTDERDWHYADHRRSLPAIKLKEECDLRGGCAAVQTQQRGDLSCVAQAVVSAIEFLETKDAERACEQFSRYFVYYNARLLQQSTPHVANIGTSVRCGISGVKKMGVCAETAWPYVPENLDRIPHPASYGSARLHQLVKYYRLRNDMDELRDCLGRGFPFVFLMRYGDDYQKRAGDREDGHVWLPRKDEIGDPESLPTHSVMAVGYNDKTKRLTFMNSKGRGWGDNGFGQLDYEYVTEHGLCRDFWTIRKVEDVGAGAIVTKK